MISALKEKQIVQLGLIRTEAVDKDELGLGSNTSLWGERLSRLALPNYCRVWQTNSHPEHDDMKYKNKGINEMQILFGYAWMQCRAVTVNSPLWLFVQLLYTEFSFIYISVNSYLKGCDVTFQDLFNLCPWQKSQTEIRMSADAIKKEEQDFSCLFV